MILVFKDSHIPVGPPPRWSDPDPPLAAPRFSARENLLRALPAVVIFCFVIYVAFSGGGYDPIVYGRIGIAAWWAVLLGVFLRIFSLDRLSPSVRVAAALLTAFALWTGLSMLWSESAARSSQELARTASYLGVFVLAAGVQRRDGLRLTLAALAAAIGLIAAVSLLSRMEPDWFPKNETIDLVGAAETRLNYPLNYWNGLAGLFAIGIPLLFHFATHGRNALARGLSAAALPAAGLGLYLTFSRGGGLALATALIVLVALHPRRRALAPQLAVAGLCTAFLIWAAESRQEFMIGMRSGEGLTQGDELVPITLVVCALMGFTPFIIRAAVGRRKRATSSRRSIRLSRRAGLVAIGASGLLLIGVATGVGAPAELKDGWERFKDPEVSHFSGRLDSVSGNGRYQWWASAVDAFESEPVVGIGAGTFQFWWARTGPIPSSLVNAHSLYFETLGELGIVGFALIVLAIAMMIGTTLRAALRAPPARRARLAAATAAAMAFAAAAATDWAWEMPILPFCFLIVLGAALGSRPPSAGRSDGRLWLPMAAMATLGILAIGPQLLGVDAIRSSQQKVREADLDGALASAQWARRVQPYSAPAALQEAQVLERIGKLPLALGAARDATRLESTNWQNWFVLSRIYSENARSEQAITTYKRATRLNPFGSFADPQEPTADGG